MPIEQLVAGEPGGASAVAAVARRPAGSKVSARVFSVSSSNKGEGGGPDSSTRATLTLRKALVSPGGDASAARGARCSSSENLQKGALFHNGRNGRNYRELLILTIDTHDHFFFLY